MSSNNTGRNWITRIALLAILPAFAGGLWLVSKAAGGTGPFAAATSCHGFTVGAHQSSAKGDTMVLRGAFAPGDHVHLAIDFDGVVSHSWEVTGALAKMVDPTGRGAFRVTKASESTIWTVDNKSDTYIPPKLLPGSTSTVSGGTVRGTGFARLEVEVDVTTAGAGVITISKTSGSAASSAPPKLAVASCSAASPPTI